MIIYAQTNNHLYNMVDIEKFEKDGDTNINFYYTNGRKVIETYPDSDTRDKVYNNLLTEFVKNVDA
jgi:hypothetical protein